MTVETGRVFCPRAARFIAKEMVQLRNRHGRFVINAGRIG
jgi:hypothetical protein